MVLCISRGAIADPPRGRYSLAPRKGQEELLSSGRRLPSCDFTFSTSPFEAEYAGKVVTIGGSDWPVVAQGTRSFQAEHPEPASNARFYLKIVRDRKGYRGVLARWQVDAAGAPTCGDIIRLVTEFHG
jgi:hypothetical protein